jgi:hypothetical protein
MNSLPLFIPSFLPRKNQWFQRQEFHDVLQTNILIYVLKRPTSIFSGSLTPLCCSIISDRKCFIFQAEYGANGRCNQSLVAKPAAFSDSDIFVSLSDLFKCDIQRNIIAQSTATIRNSPDYFLDLKLSGRLKLIKSFSDMRNVSLRFGTVSVFFVRIWSDMLTRLIAR